MSVESVDVVDQLFPGHFSLPVNVRGSTYRGDLYQQGDVTYVSRSRIASCNECGAAVLVDDPRAVAAHLEWHKRAP